MTITITDGQKTIECPFRSGEELLTVIKRYIHFNSPCGGRGFCGACKCDVKKPGSDVFKPELACFMKAEDGMVVKVRSIYPPQASLFD
ncbi:MAG TPA: hypothetical protein DCP98_05395 [Sphaerochaeta sp.]|jgi:Na+-transporting NADH:ubiquinone oxidoreductase subunit NqrF|nr:hypothetical protein [Sphaerochaeta sp.]